MKRLIALLMVCMLSISFSAVAEDVDVKALDNDTLVKIYNEAQAEVLERGLLNVLPVGVYTGEGDISKGIYICQAKQNGNIALYAGISGFIEYKSIGFWMFNEGDQFTLRLTGDICYDVRIPAIILSFTPAE